MDDQDFLDLFVEEVGEHLEALNRHLLALEEDHGQPETVNSLMRAAHTIKGAAMLMSFDPMAKLAHAMEHRLREEMKLNRPVPATLIDLLLNGGRTIDEMVQEAKSGASLESIQAREDWTRLTDQIREAKLEPGPAVHEELEKAAEASAEDAEDAEASEADDPTDEPEPAAPEGGADEPPAVESETLDADDLEAQMMLQMQAALQAAKEGEGPADEGSAPPSPPASEPPASAPSAGAAAASSPPRGRSSADGSRPPTRPGRPRGTRPPARTGTKPPKAPESRAPSRPEKPKASKGRSPVKEQIKISVEKVDQLNDLVGELLIYQARLESKEESLREITRRLDNIVSVSERAKLFGLSPLPPAVQEIQEELTGFVEDLSADLVELNYLGAEIRARSLQIRMLPAGTLLQEFRLAVRDLKRRLGKEARLLIEGGDIELDKRLLEELRPAILHIIRNSMDHGIETPDVRLEAGKPREGTIRMRVDVEGARVHIVIEDDGHGMDAAKIRERAAEHGLITPESAATISDEEALYLVMQPGFSTTDTVTDVSGRGVGMDVVRTQVEDLKGAIRISTRPGEGTRFLLDLPLTLSTAQVLMVDVSGQTLCIPIGYVEQTLLLDPSEVRREGGKPVFRLRDRTLSLYVMQDFLSGFEHRSQPSQQNLHVVILQGRGQRVGFQVTRFLEQAEVVVKTLGSYIESVAYISGATILGDGKPALILDVPDLLSSLALRRAAAARPVGPSDSVARLISRPIGGRVLVVDDSVTTRALEKGILESYGFQVLTASEGAEALEVLSHERVDLMLTDVDMPGMSGFELTQKVRGNARTKDLPIIICSSKSSDADKRRGMEVGAQAYIVKRELDQEALCQMVQRLIR